MSFSLYGGIIRKEAAHSETKYHWLGKISDFLKIVCSSAGTLKYSMIYLFKEELLRHPTS